MVVKKSRCPRANSALGLVTLKGPPSSFQANFKRAFIAFAPKPKGSQSILASAVSEYTIFSCAVVPTLQNKS